MPPRGSQTRQSCPRAGRGDRLSLCLPPSPGAGSRVFAHRPLPSAHFPQERGRDARPHGLPLVLKAGCSSPSLWFPGLYVLGSLTVTPTGRAALNAPHPAWPAEDSRVAGAPLRRGPGNRRPAGPQGGRPCRADNTLTMVCPRRAALTVPRSRWPQRPPRPGFSLCAAACGDLPPSAPGERVWGRRFRLSHRLLFKLILIPSKPSSSRTDEPPCQRHCSTLSASCRPQVWERVLSHGCPGETREGIVRSRTGPPGLP